VERETQWVVDGEMDRDGKADVGSQPDLETRLTARRAGPRVAGWLGTGCADCWFSSRLTARGDPHGSLCIYLQLKGRCMVRSRATR